MDLKGKKVTVVGLGKSGVACCNLLLEKGARVSLTDASDTPKIRQGIHSLKNKRHLVDIELGRHSENLIADRDLVVLSPGIPLNSLPILWAKKRAIPLIGEIELAFTFCPASIIAITGTNGKTTVTTLLGEIFQAAGRKSVVCGNIGVPFSSEVLRLDPEYTVILEISSFQLESIVKFKPKVAALLNLSVNHLDRHADLDEYVRAKCRIFANQDENDWSVLNAADPYKLTWAKKTRAKILYFSNNKNKELDKDCAGLNVNHFAALTISSLFGIPQESAISTCRQFKGVEHRLEEVAEIEGVKFINDSKSTNVDSTLWALNSLDRPIVLIAGGRHKGCDYAVARELIKKKVQAMVLIGETKEKIKQAFQDLVPVKIAATLPQAVQEAASLAHPGDCVLLSPMCSSFDMFADYTERGRVFKETVEILAQSVKFKA